MDQLINLLLSFGWEHSDIDLIGNIFITVLLVVIGFHTTLYAQTAGLVNRYNKIVLSSLANIFYALALKICWYIPGIIFAPSGANFHPFTLDYNWIITAIAAGMCLYSIERFSKAIGKYSKKQRYIFYLLNILGAIAIASY